MNPAFFLLQQSVAKRAVDRFSCKLEKIRGTGKTIEIAEEVGRRRCGGRLSPFFKHRSHAHTAHFPFACQFRVLTLQVIGELILSLSPEESAEVFPNLYLPIVEEANRRIWEPYRAFLPTPGVRTAVPFCRVICSPLAPSPRLASRSVIHPSAPLSLP